MAIYRGTGGSVEGISEADILVITVAQGGTGAQTAAAARTNLGLGTAATTAATDYATAAQGAKADTALQSSAIGVSVQAYNANTVVDSSYVHTDNNYTTTEKTKLSGIAEGAEVNVNADWNASSGDAQILNKPSLAAVATSGSYTDLSNKPSLATVATSGSYTDLSNTPTIPTNLDSLTDVVISTASTDQILKFNGTNWVNSTLSGSGTVTSVAMSVPTGLAVSGSPITSSGTLALTYDTGYAIPTTAKQTEWDTAYTDRNKWDGGSTGLNAATGRTSLGLGTAATTASTDYATAAQGTKADTAYGWGNHASAGYVGYTEGSTGALTIAAGTTAQRPSSPTSGMVRLNTTTKNPEWYDSTSSSWLKFSQAPSFSVDFLVIAGGGSGGGTAASSYGGGGGGAGGYRTSTGTSGGGASAESALSLVAGTSYTVTVGAGGTGPTGGTIGANGSNSVFYSVTSTGGGGGAGGTSGSSNGQTGGSGGGGAYNLTAGSGTTSQGYAGGTGNNGNVAAMGGGGGAGAAGGNGANNTTAGAGGAGVASSITGSSVTRAGGGGGGSSYGGSAAGGAGGSGGGGAGANPNTDGTNATANTGGGGGGAGSQSGVAHKGGNGGSGVVIIKYPDYLTISNPGGGLTYSTATSGGFSVTTFTAGTGSIQFA